MSWLTRDVAKLLGAAAAWGFAFSSFYLLPTFLTHELAAGPAEIGFVVGILGVSTVVFTMVAGGWIERFPRRRAIGWGSAAMGVSAIGFTLVDSLGYVLDALRVLQGASYALVVTAVGTLIAELVPRDRLSHAFGLSGGSMLIMNAIAPAVAEPLAARAGWNAVFLLAAGAALLSTALAATIVEPAPTVRSVERRRGELFALLCRPLARSYAMIVALAGAGFGTVFTFQQPYVLAQGGGNVSTFFVAYAAAAILVRVLFGSVPDRVGRHRVALASLLVYGLVMIGMARLRIDLLVVLGALFGLAHGLFYPALNAIAVSASRPEERGGIMAIFTASFSMGLWVGPTMLGVVAARFGYPPVFLVAAFGTMVAAGMLARSPELRRGDATAHGSEGGHDPAQ